MLVRLINVGAHALKLGQRVRPCSPLSRLGAFLLSQFGEGLVSAIRLAQVG